MRPAAFDAIVDFPVGPKGRELRAEVRLLGGAVPAQMVGYPDATVAGGRFVRVVPERPIEVRWKDPFEVWTEEEGLLGHGSCLFPRSPEPSDLKAAKRRAFLERLALGEKEMLAALSELRGLQGLREDEMAAFCRLSRTRLEALARSLEEDSRVRILAFCPLFLVSQMSLDYLRERILSFLDRWHKAHPDRPGAPLEKIETRFDCPKTVFVLAVRLLVRDGRLAEERGLVRLSGFQVALSADEEEVLAKLEGLILSGEFGRTSLEDIRTRFRLPEERLQALLAVLAERKRIVRGRDGFIVHSRWLEDIIGRLRRSGKRELTVADFKALTGLSRKYSIPLLELLDSLGVTRRRGSVRDVL